MGLCWLRQENGTGVGRWTRLKVTGAPGFHLLRGNPVRAAYVESRVRELGGFFSGKSRGGEREIAERTPRSQALCVGGGEGGRGGGGEDIRSKRPGPAGRDSPSDRTSSRDGGLGLGGG